MSLETRYVVLCLDELDSSGDAARVKIRPVLIIPHPNRRAKVAKERSNQNQWRKQRKHEPTRKAWPGYAIMGSTQPTRPAPATSSSCETITYRPRSRRRRKTE